MIESSNHIDINPFTEELPSHYADRLGSYYSTTATESHKKHLGQFFTSLEVSHFMASFSNPKSGKIKVLDPGCGIGILSASLIEEIVSKDRRIKTVELVAFETDVKIIQYSEKCFEYLRVWLGKKGIDLTFYLCKNDFILHNSTTLNNKDGSNENYDIIISNPPYFKLPKNDERALAAKAVIYGQTNIYSIFLLIAAKLLKKDGQLIFITPRSFCSGSYFRLFRELFFSTIDLKAIHIFNSRRSAFKRDNVLQENIIISAGFKDNKNNEQKEVTISTSTGREDIFRRYSKKHLLSNLINFNSYQKILYLPSSELDEEIIKLFKTWTGSLNLYGLEVSTGPVVDFRSLEMIKFQADDNTVPLIWLHNVKSMCLKWPMDVYKGKKKGQYIINDKSSASRLVKNSNYVLIRRFSTKDDNRRLVASPFLQKDFSNVPMLGIENHLNYIYNKRETLTINQALGLSALLNSSLFDLYFRTFNGNINVSATELRNFPLPDFKLIELLGQKINMQKLLLGNIDALILDTFNLSIDLSEFYG